MATKKETLKSNLTEEQKKEVMERVRDRFMNYMLGGGTSGDENKMKEMAAWLYSFNELTPPPVYIVDSPVAAQFLANVLDREYTNFLQKKPGYRSEMTTKEKFDLLDKSERQFYSFCYYGSLSDYGWVANYQYFNEIGEADNDTARKLEEYFASGIYDSIQFEEACILVHMPKYIKVEDGRLHCLTGPSIEFRDGEKMYHIRGRAVDNDLFEKCLNGNLTADEFIHETNEERRAAMFAIMGQVKMCQLLGAEEVDSRTIVHRNGESETISLLKTKEIFRELGNKPLAWVRRVCPSTANVYLTPTRPEFTDALEAAKFHRSGVPGAESLDYVWDSRS